MVAVADWPGSNVPGSAGFGQTYTRVPRPGCGSTIETPPSVTLPVLLTVYENATRSPARPVEPAASGWAFVRLMTGLRSSVVTTEAFDQMIDDLRSGALSGEIPPHGTLGRNRQHIPADKFVGAPDPDDVTEGPAWIPVSVGENS